MNIDKAKEEKILKSYEKLLNWGVKKFLKSTEASLDAEDIKQEGRIVILKLIRDYDDTIGSLDGYIKSLFYKKLRNSLRLYRKRLNKVAIENMDYLSTDKRVNENLIEKFYTIELVCTGKEFKNLMQYARGEKKYVEVKNDIARVKRKIKSG